MPRKICVPSFECPNGILPRLILIGLVMEVKRIAAMREKNG